MSFQANIILNFFNWLIFNTVSEMSQPFNVVKKLFRVLTEIVSYCILLYDIHFVYYNYCHNWGNHLHMDFLSILNGILIFLHFAKNCMKQILFIFLKMTFVSQVLFRIKIIIQNDKTLIVLLITHDGFKK